MEFSSHHQPALDHGFKTQVDLTILLPERRKCLWFRQRSWSSSSSKAKAFEMYVFWFDEQMKC